MEQECELINPSRTTNNLHKLNGACHCGNISLDISLSMPPSSFQVRICDCDFCRKHGAGFISDVHGSLVISIRDAGQSGQYQQGSSTADFLFCKKCGVFAAVTLQSDGRLYSAVNFKTISGNVNFGAEVPVSPKLLSVSEKAARWKNNWFCDVTIQ
jgi:hypothetical protein